MGKRKNNPSTWTIGQQGRPSDEAIKAAWKIIEEAYYKKHGHWYGEGGDENDKLSEGEGGEQDIPVSVDAASGRGDVSPDAGGIQAVAEDSRAVAEL